MTTRIYVGLFLVAAALVAVDVATNIVMRPHRWSCVIAPWVLASVWSVHFGIGLGALVMLTRNKDRDFSRAYAEMKRIKRHTDIVISDWQAIDRVEYSLKEKNARINHDPLNTERTTPARHTRAAAVPSRLGKQNSFLDMPGFGCTLTLK